MYIQNYLHLYEFQATGCHKDSFPILNKKDQIPNHYWNLIFFIAYCGFNDSAATFYKINHILRLINEINCIIIKFTLNTVIMLLYSYKKSPGTFKQAARRDSGHLFLVK
jgi:hypothetical protein